MLPMDYIHAEEAVSQARCNQLPDLSDGDVQVQGLKGYIYKESSPLSVDLLPPISEWEMRSLDNLNLGFTSPVWLQLCLENRSTDTWFGQLMILNAFLESLEFYSRSEGPWEQESLTLDRFLSTNITIQESTRHFYLIRFNEKLPARLPFLVQAGQIDLSQILFMDGIVFGALFILILYSLTIWLFSREIDYIYYVFLLLIFLLHRSFFQGLANVWLPPWILEYRLEIALSAICALNMFLFFWINSFARDALQNTAWARVSPIAASSFLLVLLLSWVFPYQINRMLYSIMVPATILVSALSFAALGKGFKPARFFFVANLGYPFSAILGVLVQGSSENAPALVILHFIDIGILYQVSFISLAIADKIRFRNEKREADLEKIVAERTVNLQRMVEEKMEAQRIAEQASRTKSEFLANMSHEIRTPMNALLGTADLLAYTKLNEEQKKHLQVFQKAGRTLMNILNDILDISRIESGNIEIETEPFSPGDLLKTLELTYAPSPDGPVKLIFEGKHLPPRLLGDPHRLFQIAGNLISNALKFTDHGWVEVRTSYTAAGVFLIEVQDTGRGIPEEQQSSLFQRFFQIRDGQKTTISGTGLGLSICKSLVEKMDGKIEVQSAPGKGSLFRVQIPLPEASSGVQEVKFINQTGPIRNLTVLAVDDNPDNLYLLERLLQKQGHKTIATSRPDEALYLITENWFDLIILDIQMPEMDGFQMLEEIRSRGLVPPDRPIAAITAYASAEDRRSILEAGFQAYLSKPISPKSLEEMLKDLFSRSAGQAS
tara:strand:+ start:22038 stop:24368 length:2331 start_codon:yes stop_codon:yes gene_type:complete